MMNTDNLFFEEFEQQAINRIIKFSNLSKKMGFVPVLGFSGGKDSQVCYDLCKRAKIPFKAVFNHCFESSITLHFIKKYYPDVVWRREVKEGFLENIIKNHGGMLPTAERAYCCEDYKHNKKFVDAASIVGVRRQESAKRKKRKLLEVKTKTFLKKNKKNIFDYFSEGCVASGAPSEIQLKPILDWTENDVLFYLKKYNLPQNPEYKEFRRVGCVICPKAGFNSNYKALLKFPKLITAIIKIKEKTSGDCIIKSDNKDYTKEKAEYVCRWLNHSFRPFTEKQKIFLKKVLEKYNEKTQSL